jgi:hypothetical protein
MNVIISIYVLRDPLSNVVRYVGQTQNIKRRLYFHVYECKLKRKYYSAKKDKWIESLVKIGKMPVLEVIQQTRSPIEANKIEQEYINQFASTIFNIGKRVTPVYRKG